MTISASDGFDADDVLARNLGLYRDLSVALNDRVAELKAAGGDAGGKEAVAAAMASHRQLQTVLELEAHLVKRSRSRTDGGGRELDLDAARAEILARLALWSGR